MVSKKSIKYLKQASYAEINELKNSGHYYYDKTDWDFLLSEFNDMLNTKV